MARRAASTTSCPCVSNESLNAVFALGRRESGEPLTSEDMALLSAVASQAAIAIENGRLYRQLHVKASELDRLRTFNENILESLDDGLLVIGLDHRVIRWNQALERFYGVTRADALGQPLDRLFDAIVRRRRCVGAAEARAAGHHPLPRAARGAPRHGSTSRACSST